MEIQHFYPTTKTVEVEKYGELRFTPINVEFFIRLMDWHQKSFGDVQKALPDASQNQEARTLLLFQDMLACLIHTATSPFLKADYTFDAWKAASSTLVLSRPALVEWFMQYFNIFMPEEKKRGK